MLIAKCYVLRANYRQVEARAVRAHEQRAARDAPQVHREADAAWGDMGRCGEIWGDTGRYREIAAAAARS